MNKQQFGTGAKRVSPRRVDTEVAANDGTILEKKKQASSPAASPEPKRVSNVPQSSSVNRGAVQHSWDLKVLAFGTLIGCVPAAISFYLLARGMHTAAAITAAVILLGVFSTSQLILDQFDILRDKLTVARGDSWFYVGFCMLGAPAGIGLGLLLG